MNTCLFSKGFIGVKCFSRINVPVDPSRLTLGIKCFVVCSSVWCLPTFNVLNFFGGVEIGDGSDGSGHWGLSSSSCRITAIVANTLKGLGGKLRSLRLGSTNRCWLPDPYGSMGSLESESIVTNCGPGEAREEIVIVSLDMSLDSSVELRIAGVLFLIG